LLTLAAGGGDSKVVSGDLEDYWILAAPNFEPSAPQVEEESELLPIGVHEVVAEVVKALFQLSCTLLRLVRF
jgi:hypothetical protein